MDIASLRQRKMEEGNGKEMENDRQRAEVFDALGHPTRIAILKALREGTLGFAELKKKVDIESSGHIQHHLTKLDGLIKTDAYGKYCLSDQGKDALVTVETVENASGTRAKNSEKVHSRRLNGKLLLKSVSVLLVALLIASSAFAVYEYSQTASLNRQIQRSNEVNFEAAAYFSEFGLIPATNVNASFTPPVSMYRALQLALETEGWNKTSLYGMNVGAYLTKWETFTNATGSIGNGSRIIDLNGGTLTSPPADYSDVFGDGVVYRYVW
jgi:DNA-binding HxlR family transcriptional regulator